MDEGARIIDIGAESTRPGATPLTAEQEWERLHSVLPDIIHLCHKREALVSLDTRHPESATKAIDAGVDWINDVSGFSDPKMVAAVRETECRLVVMHSLSVPADPEQLLPENEDPVAHLQDWWALKKQVLLDSGIAAERLIFDPGIGFGKTPQQSLVILKRIRELQAEGTPLLVGHSRKSFLSLFTENPAAERDPETAVVSAFLAESGVKYLRVHHVGVNARALVISGALHG